MLDDFIVFRGVHEQEQLHRCLDSCTDEQDGQSHGERHIPEDDGQRDDRKDEREDISHHKTNREQLFPPMTARNCTRACKAIPDAAEAMIRAS